MVEYSYPECTTAVVTGLAAFRARYPDYRRKDIDGTILRAANWVRRDQRQDGSWYGSWGICFTYAGMFAMECLSSLGEHYENSEAQKRACEFLVGKQNEDGGWGESYSACETGVWSQHQGGSQVVNTAWAVLGLMYARYPDTGVLKRGLKVVAAGWC
jgi:lanosterol synthase